jgi:hypothetical protein
MPFVLLAVVPTLDSDRDESAVHEYFKAKREAGEFFRVDASEVSEFFQTHIFKLYNDEMQLYGSTSVGTKRSFDEI